MKFFFIILILIFNLSLISPQITGEASSEKIELTINVKDFFYFNLISPKNGTYITNNLNLNYEEKNTDQILFNVNETQNISIKNANTINFSEGTNNLNIYITKNNKTIKKSYKINIDTKKYKIIYTNYDNFNQTTKIKQIPIEKYNSIKNLTIKNNLGKITFLEPINITKELIANNNTLNFNKNTYINHKEIYINQNNLKNFNKKANIELYQVELKKPKIQKNNKDCKEECETISYQNKTFKFKVKSFSKYSLVESSLSRPGNILDIIYKSKNAFEINQSSVKTQIFPNEEKNLTIKIKNNINENIKITTDIKNKIFSNIEKEIILEPFEEKEIDIKINIPKNQTIKTYTEKIKFNSKQTSKELLILINLQSTQPSLNLKIDVLNEEELRPQDILTTYSEIIKIDDKKEKINASIKYEIKKENEKKIITKEENINLVDIKQNIDNFLIPKFATSGFYIVSLEVQYANKSGTASESFIVKEKKNYTALITIIISIIIIGTILYKLKKSKSRGK